MSKKNIENPQYSNGGRRGMTEEAKERHSEYKTQTKERVCLKAKETVETGGKIRWSVLPNTEKG